MKYSLDACGTSSPVSAQHWGPLLTEGPPEPGTAQVGWEALEGQR